MRIGVFIPTIPRHFEWIGNICAEYAAGKVRPDRIACLLSSCGEVEPSDKVALKRAHPEIEISEHGPALHTGPTRQHAYRMLADCDVICYQDSDDLPHCDRIRVVRELFVLHPETMVVNHGCARSNCWAGSDAPPIGRVVTGAELYDQYFPGGDFLAAARQPCFGTGVPWMVHAGVPCVRREVLEEVRWRDIPEMRIAPEPRTKSEDFEFCFECMYKYRERHLVVESPCYLYRT